MKRVFAVGIGPGAPELLTGQARAVLERCAVVVGYRLYLDLLQPLLAGKRLVAGGMRGERERCVAALEAALAGEEVALVSSGDAGAYGLAGLLLELTQEARFAEVEIEVVPGVTAALACAALVGAPFMNDFAVLSLSDLMTPAETIRRRLEAVAASDLPAALYNPASSTRHELLEFAVECFRRHGGDGLPCAIVRDAWRPGQFVRVFPIREFPFAMVQMTTLVILGNSQCRIASGRLFCRRGYR